MKVAIVTESRIWGGLEVHAVTFAGSLVASGHEATMACIGAETRRLYEGRLSARIRVLEIEPPPRRSVIGWWRALRALDADAVALEKGTLWTGGAALDAVLRLKYRRFVAIQQLEPPALPPRTSRRLPGGLPGGTGLWWYRWKWAGYFRSVGPRLTVAVSDAVRDALVSQYGFPGRKVVTIRNGVDLSVFRPDQVARVEMRREWNVPDDAFVVGLVSRLVYHKGLDVAIEACHLLGQSHPDRPLFLIVAGEGPERPALEALVGRLGLRDRVRFLGLVRAPSRCYQALDVYVMPSRSEALGIALLEAMGAGCRVIGSDVGGIREILKDGTLGDLVQPEDPRELHDLLARLLTSDSAESAAATEWARDYLRANFDARALCGQIERLIVNLRAAGPRGLPAAPHLGR